MEVLLVIAPFTVCETIRLYFHPHAPVLRKVINAALMRHRNLSGGLREKGVALLGALVREDRDRRGCDFRVVEYTAVSFEVFNGFGNAGD